MKINKDTQAVARRLFRLCCQGSVVLPDRVRAVAAGILQRKPRHHIALLIAFTKLVEFALKARTATIRSAALLTDSERHTIQRKLTAKYGEGLTYDWQVDPALLGGLRIQVGDAVTDGSVRSRLERLCVANQTLS